MTDKPRTGKKIGKLKSFGLDLHIAAYTQATDKGAPDRIASFEVDPQPSSGLISAASSQEIDTPSLARN
jgi:hypothetical protein